MKADGDILTAGGLALLYEKIVIFDYFFLSRSSPPAVKISPSASMKRQAKLKALADELTVLSQEDVVDTALIIKPGTKNGTLGPKTGTLGTKVGTKTEAAVVPTRSLAGKPGYTDQDDDENYNKGCYYFIACLDSLWIL